MTRSFLIQRAGAMMMVAFIPKKALDALAALPDPELFVRWKYGEEIVGESLEPYIPGQIQDLILGPRTLATHVNGIDVRLPDGRLITTAFPTVHLANGDSMVVMQCALGAERQK